MKKAPESPKKENSERWLLTYSDMITLLLALFIILYSSSTINEKKLQELAKNFHSALNNTGTSQGAGSGTGAGNGNALSVKPSSSAAASSGAGAGTVNGAGKVAADKALDAVFNTLQNYIKQNHLEDQIGLENTNDYIQIHLKDVVMFEPNSPDMLTSSQPIMKEIEDAISSVYAYVDHITISGHTADVVVHSTQSDQISWKLSTDRAVTVLNSMIGYGLKQDKLSIQGYSHFMPVASNDTPEGQAKNRRVEITIYKAPVSTGSQGVQAAEKAALSSSSASSAASSGTSSGAASGASSSVSSGSASAASSGASSAPESSTASK
jgi:chemotaxis protein MotB